MIQRKSAVCLDLLAKRTNELLSEMRNRLHFQFQVELDILFTKLFNDITTAKGGAALVELMNVIRQASSELKERVVTAAEWFKSAAQLEMGKLPFDRVLEIATSTFQNINGKRENMDLIWHLA